MQTKEPDAAEPTLETSNADPSTGSVNFDRADCGVTKLELERKRRLHFYRVTSLAFGLLAIIGEPKNQ